MAAVTQNDRTNATAGSAGDDRAGPDRATAAAAADRESTIGVASALAAFMIWGFAPIFFKALSDVPVLEVLAHRVVWSLGLALGLLALGISGGFRQLRRAMASRRTLATFTATALLISVNWVIFIWAVGDSRVLEISLGYYINPLVNVMLGVVVLGERLSRLQLVSVLLAGIGVANLTIVAGAPPWAGLALAVSFALYGLLRKTARAESLVGLTLETAIMAPLALIYLAVLAWNGAGSLGAHGLGTDLMLIFAGVITALPLLLFAHGARRLRLSTIGLLQYLSPSMQFILAVLWWNEPFTTAHLITYGCIWAALALYTWESTRRRASAGPP